MYYLKLFIKGKCVTKGGPDTNKLCKIPFEYSETRHFQKFIKYNNCALDHLGKAWCPTKLDSDGKFITRFWGNPNISNVNKNWGYCGDNCQIIEPPAGEKRTCLDYNVENEYFISSTLHFEKVHALFDCLPLF